MIDDSEGDPYDPEGDPYTWDNYIPSSTGDPKYDDPSYSAAQFESLHHVYTVAENTKIRLNGKKYLLEKGDKIRINMK